MKLVKDMIGTPIDADYEMLRAALTAAQAATATGRAANAPPALEADAAEALHQLMTGAVPWQAGARTLDHGFARRGDGLARRPGKDRDRP